MALSVAKSGTPWRGQLLLVVSDLIAMAFGWSLPWYGGRIALVASIVMARASWGSAVYLGLISCLLGRLRMGVVGYELVGVLGALICTFLARDRVVRTAFAIRVASWLLLVVWSGVEYGSGCANIDWGWTMGSFVGSLVGVLLMQYLVPSQGI